MVSEVAWTGPANPSRTPAVTMAMVAVLTAVAMVAVFTVCPFLLPLNGGLAGKRFACRLRFLNESLEWSCARHRPRSDAHPGLHERRGHQGGVVRSDLLVEEERDGETRQAQR